jgi:DNA polymerase
MHSGCGLYSIYISILSNAIYRGHMQIARLDFETYSEAGYYWDTEENTWIPTQAKKPGIKGVGAAVYAEHPSTKVLCAAYDLGHGPQLWINVNDGGYFPPLDLFNFVKTGGLVEAHNSFFEYMIWNNVCVKKYKWPKLHLDQMRCSAARVRSLSIPGDLKSAAAILKVKNQKIEDGARLIKKFSIPKNPTKKDGRRRIRPEDDPVDAANIYRYCLGDIAAEADISDATPDLLPEEFKIWQLDQRINVRGVYIDKALLEASIRVVDACIVKYTTELSELTGGAVDSANKIKKLSEWLRGRGTETGTLAAEDVDRMLSDGSVVGDSRRALELRSLLGLSSVKKLYTLKNQLCADGRTRDLFLFCGALHTGRWAGKGVQPQNLTESAPNMDEIIADILKNDMEKYKNPIDAVSSCLRGLFCAAPGKKLICSDFKAIEAVVLACLAGEQWRIDVFKTHGMIYEMSASKISGIPFQDFLDYPKLHNGEKHPLRKTLGKISELASGYQGWIGAWVKFGADKFMSEDEMKRAILRWRAESPAIVNFWAEVSDRFTMATLNPGICYNYRGLGFGVKDNILHIHLPSGRFLRYHEPLANFVGHDWNNKPLYKLSYRGKNSNPARGGMGWTRIGTYGGSLTENIVQAVSRDILANALLNLDAAGYTPVLHVHDEPVAEVNDDFGTLQEFEKCMMDLPAWAAGWPIKVGGGWQGQRYHK